MHVDPVKTRSRFFKACVKIISRFFKACVKAFSVYRHPRVCGMFFLGFSAGLPLLLVGGTLMARLRETGIDLTTIGFVSWVGMAHSLKILLAPVVDRMPIPFFTRKMGRRRSWMFFSQMVLFFSLLGMAKSQPGESLFLIAVCAVFAGTASAVQDIAVDAYRIEAVGKALQGPMAASYVLGYRIALLAAGAGALHLASVVNWPFAYGFMTALVCVGMAATLIIREPRPAGQTERIFREQAGMISLERVKEVLSEAVVAPFVEFWRRYGDKALWVLFFISIFRISDLFMGVMANPFYLDTGFKKEEIANVTAFFGLAMTLTGVGVGGMLVVRFGIARMLVLTAILAPLTNLVFCLLALSGPRIDLLVFAIIADNITGGMATSVFLTYLSRITSTTYTATQYALFSSLMTLPGQFLAGFTGKLVDEAGYVVFFILSACVGIPAIFLSLRIVNFVNPDQQDDEGKTV